MELFTRSPAAATAAEKSHWDFADAIVADMDEAKRIAPQGATYAILADAIHTKTGMVYSTNTLKDRARAARAFPEGKRSSKLTFRHHVALAPERFDSTRDALVAQAEAEGWSVDELLIRTDRQPAHITPATVTSRQVEKIVAEQPEVAARAVAGNVASNAAFHRDRIKRDHERAQAARARKERIRKTVGNKQIAFAGMDLTVMLAEAEGMEQKARKLRRQLTDHNVVGSLDTAQRETFIQQASEVATTLDNAAGEIRMGVVEARNAPVIDTSQLG